MPTCDVPTWSARPATRVFFPLDEALQLLPRHPYSPRLLELIVRLGTWFPFERVPEALHFVTGAAISASTARRLTEEAGQTLVASEEAEVARIEREHPAVPAGPVMQQVSADGAMVPLVGGEWAEVRTVAIGTVEQRQTADGEEEPHCYDLSYFSRLSDAESFTRLAVLATHRCGTERAGTVVGVMDGAAWLQGFLDTHRPDAVRILDFPHAAEHLTLVAQAAFGSQAEPWLSTQLHTLKHEDPLLVLQHLRNLALRGEAAQVRDRVLHYLEERQEQIAYPHFRAQGYPIGSGIVESANKLVIEERLKGSGMHWKREHVSPMVALRAMERSGTWQRQWSVIWQRERAEAHPPHPPQASPPPAPAQTAPPTPPPQRLGVLDGPPCMENGKPTQHHPWRS